jgi:membrane protease YdiL (CAAX protease family)
MLRAGWRILIYAVLVELCGRVLFRLVPTVTKPATVSAQIWQTGVEQWKFVAVVVAPAFVMRRLERRSWRDYGFGLLPSASRWFGSGVLSGAIVITIVMAVMTATRTFGVASIALTPAAGAAWGLSWAAIDLGGAVSEEFFFRGYLLMTLADGIRFWPASVCISVAFGALHLTNPEETALGAFNAMLFGLFFCSTVRKSGGLWFAIGMHLAINWTQDFVYSVPLSGRALKPGHLLAASVRGPGWLTGGSAGPEGSIVTAAAITLAFCAFHYVHWQRRHEATRDGAMMVSWCRRI